MGSKADRIRTQGRIIGTVAGFVAGLAVMLGYLWLAMDGYPNVMIAVIIWFGVGVPVYLFIRSRYNAKAQTADLAYQQESKEEAKAQIETLKGDGVGETELALFGGEPTIEDINMIKTGAAYIGAGDVVEAYVGCISLAATTGAKKPCMVVITDKALHFIKTTKDYQPMRKPEHISISRETPAKVVRTTPGGNNMVSIQWKDNGKSQQVILLLVTQYSRQKKDMQNKLEGCLQQMSRN